MVVGGLRSLLSSVGKIGSRFGRRGVGGFSRLGGAAKTLRKPAGVSSRTSFLSKFRRTPSFRPDKIPLLGSKITKSARSYVPLNVKSRLTRFGSKAYEQLRRGAKSVYRKFETDPLGSGAAIYSATREPNVKLTIDGLETKAKADNPEFFKNFASFSSW